MLAYLTISGGRSLRYFRLFAVCYPGEKDRNTVTAEWDDGDKF